LDDKNNNDTDSLFVDLVMHSNW